MPVIIAEPTSALDDPGHWDSDSMFAYTAYGLSIGSSIEIPEFVPGGGAVSDLTIRLGSVPRSLAQPYLQGLRFQAAPEQFLLDLPGIARFVVRKGRQIVIDPEPD